jgi:hypothetical protein
VLVADDRAVREIEDALRIAERSGDDLALAFGRLTLGFALVHRQTDAERDRGQKLLAEVSEAFVREGHNLRDLPIVNVYLARVYLARDRARRGDCDDAIPLMRATVDHLFREGQLLGWGVPATGVLVETLLERGADGDVAEAKGAIERLAAAPTDDGLVIREVWLLRLRALLARARGDETGYRDYRDRYHAMATSLGYEGHIEVGRGDAMRPGRQRVRRSSAAEFVTAFGYQPCQRSDVRLSRAVNAASVSNAQFSPCTSRTGRSFAQAVNAQEVPANV